MEILLELNKFNHIKYYDLPHKYYSGAKELTSATKFIGGFKHKFETEKLAEQYANRRGLNKDDVIADWDKKRDVSTIKGSAFHSYAENYWQNRIFPYDGQPSIKQFGIDLIKENYDKCIENFHKFYEDAKKNLVPVAMEVVVGDLDYGIAGMVDCLFWNKKSNELQIWDYKTNKEIKTKNDFGEKYKNPISHLDVCEINTYSLQLGLYKHIIQKNTSLKIGGMYLIWINEMNDTYKLFPCKDLTAELKLMLETIK